MVAEIALYEVLGVTHSATNDEIRKSYRQAALRWHPDRNLDDPAAADKFKACLKAYEILSDPEKRAKYDELGMSGVDRAAAAAAPPQQPSQPSQSSQSSRYQAPQTERPSARQDRRPQEPQQGKRRSESFSCPRPAADFFTETMFEFEESPQQGGNSANFQSSYYSASSASTRGTEGTYSAQYQSWNNVDGHTSGSHRGNFDDDFVPAPFQRRSTLNDMGGYRSGNRRGNTNDSAHTGGFFSRGQSAYDNRDDRRSYAGNAGSSFSRSYDRGPSLFDNFASRGANMGGTFTRNPRLFYQG